MPLPTGGALKAAKAPDASLDTSLSAPLPMAQPPKPDFSALGLMGTNGGDGANFRALLATGACIGGVLGILGRFNFETRCMDS